VVKELEPRLATLIKAAHVDSSAEAEQRVQATRLELLAADAWWSEFAQAMAQKYPISEGQSYPLERVQAVLGEKQAIVGWLDFKVKKDEYVSWAYVVRHQGPVTWVRLPGLAEAVSGSPFDLARACRNALQPAEDPDTAVAAFSKARIQPPFSVLDGIEDLIVIPTGAMATIPVEALIDEQGRRLVDWFTISYAPSATICTWLREEHRESKPTNDRQISSGKALLLGDPPFTPAQRDAMMGEGSTVAMATMVAVDDAVLRRAVVGDEGALAALPRLRNTRTEVRAIADLSGGATVLLGPEASEQAIVELAESGDLGRYRTIHVATHALVDQEWPERSCLVLSRVDLPEAYEAAKRGGTDLRRSADGAGDPAGVEAGCGPGDAECLRDGPGPGRSWRRVGGIRACLPSGGSAVAPCQSLEGGRPGDIVADDTVLRKSMAQEDVQGRSVAGGEGMVAGVRG